MWPYAVLLPVTLLPIAGKTVRQLVYETSQIEPAFGWIVYGVLPVMLALGVMLRSLAGQRRDESAAALCARMLLAATWLFFALNFAFFRYPWPWQPWTARTPNALVYTTFAVALTIVARRGRAVRSLARQESGPANI